MACRIDKDLLHIKMVYFSYLGAFACMLPYISVYLIHIGLAVWQVGIIRSLEPILTFICSPVWGSVADRYSKHRIFISIAITGAGVLYFIFLFVPLMTGVSPDSLLQDTAVTCPEDTIEWNNHHLMCDNDVALMDHGSMLHDATNDSMVCTDLCAAGMLFGSHDNHNSGFGSCLIGDGGWECYSCPGTVNSHSEDIPEETLTLYGLSCTSPTGYSVLRGSENVTDFQNPPSAAPQIENNVSRSSCQQSVCCQCVTENVPNPRQGITFAICIVFAVLGVAFNCNILMFFDALTMELLKGRPKADYGKNRVWGAVSWGLFALLSGLAIDVYTDLTNAKTDRLEPAFIMYLLGMLICLAIFLNMKLPEHKKPEAMKKNLQVILCDGEVILFLFVVVVTGISFVLTFTYVFIFMKELDSPYLLLGLAVSFTAVAEIPFMYFSGAIIQRVGYAGVMYMTLLAYAIRYFSYSFVYNPWFILPVQLLHGITYGLAWPMFTAFANSAAPKGMASTLQSIVACSFMGIGAGIGNFVGGLIYEEYGARILFRCNGALCLLAFVIFFFFTVFVVKKRERKGTSEEAEEKEPDKCNMKDAPVDAIDWEDVEKHADNDHDDDEGQGLVQAAPDLDEVNTNQNDTDINVHAVNI